MKNNYIFTSESVSDGHPDKVADQISDALVDAGLKAGDETTRVAVETLVTTNSVTLAGEVKNFNVTNEEVHAIVRKVVKEIGYEQAGFHWDFLRINSKIHNQSSDIALGTDDFGAGDQGIMFGYACNDNEAFLPAPIYFSHEILKKLKEARLEHPEDLGPDAKAQVSVEYEGGNVKRVDQIVISTQHLKGREYEAKQHAWYAAKQVLGDLIDDKTIWHINPTGNFVIGGPDGDAGVTGRKIIVDTYGGYAPHGGGAFSGKDPTKVDRSAAYMARWLAKNVVAHQMADWCQIQLSYAIGVKEPTSVYVDSNGHNRSIEKFIRENIDLTPKGIIDRFKLFEFYQYRDSCTYGHFGNKNVPWEQIGWNLDPKKPKKTIEDFSKKQKEFNKTIKKDVQEKGEKYDKDPFSGKSICEWPKMFCFRELFGSYHTHTYLDYGCGPGTQHDEGGCMYKLQEEFKYRVARYDPTFPPHDVFPSNNNYAGVSCIDVLEHIPESEIGDVLDYMFSVAQKWVYLHISTRRNAGAFEDGTPYHITLKTPDEWSKIINRYSIQYPNLTILLSTDYPGDKLGFEFRASDPKVFTIESWNATEIMERKFADEKTRNKKPGGQPITWKFIRANQTTGIKYV